MTYPDPEVESFLRENVVFFKPRIDEETELARRFAVTWTPGLLWLDREGTPQHQNVGYFEPQEFLAEALLGQGRVLAGNGDWKGALQHFDSLVARFPESFAAPAGLYWGGVAAKRATDELPGLAERWNRLLDEHPDSAWAMKASFLRDK